MIRKIGRILKRRRSGEGAKSCRFEQGERVIDVGSRGDADLSLETRVRDCLIGSITHLPAGVLGRRLSPERYHKLGTGYDNLRREKD